MCYDTVNVLLSRFSQHPSLSKRLLARTCRGRPLTASQSHLDSTSSSWNMPVAPVLVLGPTFATRRRRTLCFALGDPHRVLGLPRDAQASEVKTAFRRLALQFHPDVSRDPHSAHRFHEIQAAYDAIVHHLHTAGQEAGHHVASEHLSGALRDAAPEDKAARLSAQLEGLANRAAVREARAKAAAYAQSARLHATRGSVAGACSTDAGRERLQGQLGELWRRRQQALAEPDAETARQPGNAPPLLPAPAPERDSRDSLRQLVRLGRLARAWRERSAQGR